MTIEAIAEAIKLTAQLQELHGVNPFKVKALANAAYRLDKTNISLEGKSLEELSAIEGTRSQRSTKLSCNSIIFLCETLGLRVFAASQAHQWQESFKSMPPAIFGEDVAFIPDNNDVLTRSC